MKFGCIKQVDKSRITAVKDLKAEVSCVSPTSLRSDEDLSLETSAFQISHGVNSTFINLFDETKFSH